MTYTISSELHHILTSPNTPTKKPNGGSYSDYELKRIRNQRKNERKLQSQGLSSLHLATVIEESSEIEYAEPEPEKNDSDPEWDGSDDEDEPEEIDIDLVRVCKCIYVSILFIPLSR